MLDMSKVRYFPPSRVDKAAFGTIIYVDIEGEGIKPYVQLSSNADEPDWQKGRNLLELVFKDFIEDSVFIEHLISNIKDNNNDNFIKLLDFLKNKKGNAL